MRVTTIVLAAVIASAASFGTASAAEPASTLDSVKATPMNAAELKSVRGGVPPGPPGIIVVQKGGKNLLLGGGDGSAPPTVVIPHQAKVIN